MKIENSQNYWDLVIEPQSSIFSLNLKDVWRYRDLLGLLVRRDFISFYKQTIFGPLWFFIQPLFTTITFTFIFGNLASISTDGLPQPLFYMCGIITWNYFADCLTKTSSVFKDNAGIFGKVYFPRLIMPLSIVASNLVKLSIQLLMFLLLFLYFIIKMEFNHQLSFNLFLFPLFLLLMAGLGLGLGMIISALTTKYRDLTFLISFGVQLFMYATPVIYPLSAAPEKYKAIIALNPMSPIIEGIRYSLLGKGAFSLESLIYVTMVTSFILITGIIIFNRVEKSFVDTV